MSMIQQYRDELLKILDQAFSAQEEALERAAGDALADADRNVGIKLVCTRFAARL